jgi:hypothetical protein
VASTSRMTFWTISPGRHHEAARPTSERTMTPVEL